MLKPLLTCTLKAAITLGFITMTGNVKNSTLWFSPPAKKVPKTTINTLDVFERMHPLLLFK